MTPLDSWAGIRPTHGTTATDSARPGSRELHCSPAGEQTALQQQVRDLEDDLARERARADKLQNLVRVLETRLGIKSKTPQTRPPR